MYRSFVSLGRYTPKYFILFVAMVNGIVSLISLSVFSLLEYRNARDFCVLITLYAKQKKRHKCTEQTFGLCGESEGGMFQENSIKTCILSRVKEITRPGGVHETSARAWCTGKTQRNRVEREVGGGIRMGNTCKYTADSCQCMTETTTIL